MIPVATAPPQRIPVATDLSERAGLAVRRSTQLAQQHRAHLSALHVLPPALDTELVACARSALDLHLERFAPRWPAQPAIRHGAPPDEIVAEAAERGAGLVVVGAHGADWLADVFLGSTSEDLVRLSHVPVLVVKNQAADAYRTVVLAAEPSPVSVRAAIFGSALTPSAEHVVAHISVVVGENLMRISGVDEAQIKQLREVSTERVRHDIGRLAANLKPAPTAVVVDSGHPSTRLLGVCQRYRADLIVVGTGGRSAVAYTMLGSVAQQVLKQTRSDVLVVPVVEE